VNRTRTSFVETDDVGVNGSPFDLEASVRDFSRAEFGGGDSRQHSGNQFNNFNYRLHRRGTSGDTTLGCYWA